MPVDAVVDVIIGVGPKVVIGIRPKHIVEEIGVDVGPENRSEPAEHEAAAPPRPGRTKEPAVEARRPELRSQRHVGDGAVAEHLVTCAHARRGAPKLVGRCPADMRCLKGTRPTAAMCTEVLSPAVSTKPAAVPP